jgi:MFS transporter, PAT family, beta-lactamase induction signal transducer AmpG
LSTRPSTFDSLRQALTSWRLGAVSLLSLTSGMPYGLLSTCFVFWLAEKQVDTKTIGLLTLVQLPYGTKFLWAPVLDRLSPPFLGLRRGWMFIFQAVLAVGTGLLVAISGQPSVGSVAAIGLLIAFASASYDVAYDAYAVEALVPEEHGYAVGARSLLYRGGMALCGNLAISFGPLFGWDKTFAFQVIIYVVMLVVVLRAPEPVLPAGRAKTLTEALWLPFVGFLSRHRALEIAAFIFFYRLADAVAASLVSAFLKQKGYSPLDIGIVRGGFSIAGTMAGTFIGGLWAARMGVGRALWIFGALQIISNGGYAVVAATEVNSVTLQTAIVVETVTGGMAAGAFGMLLLRLTDKRFSATQFALLSSLVGLARTLVGPPSGILADALGWRDFFLSTMLFGIPGLLLLSRFVPFSKNMSDANLQISEMQDAPRTLHISNAAIPVWGLVSGVLTVALNLSLAAGMSVYKRRLQDQPPTFIVEFLRLCWPQRAADAGDVMSAVVFGLIVGLGTAATLAARRK